MKRLDEKHKFGLLVSLIEAQRIHAICFVVRKTTEISDGLIKDYIDIFATASRQPSYHVAFTYVNDPFDPELAKKEVAFRDRLGISPQFHYINNVPTKHIPGSSHFAAVALSNMLKEFCGELAAYVGDLKYPKTNFAYGIHDESLISAYRTLIQWLGEEEERLTAVLEVTQRAREPLLGVTSEQIDRCKEQISELDTDESVVVGVHQAQGSGQRGTWPARVHLSTNASATILHVDYWSSVSGKWENKSGGEGFKYHRATFVGASWGDAEARITLKGSKREKFAAELLTLRARFSSYSQELIRTRDRTRDLDAIIDDARMNASQMRDRRALAEGELEMIELNHFTVEQFGRSIDFFTSDTVYGSALGYQLKSTVPQSLLPPSNLEYQMALSFKSSEQKRQLEMEMLRKQFLVLLEEDIKEKHIIKTQLRQYQKQCLQLLTNYSEVRQNLSEFPSQLSDAKLGCVEITAIKFLSKEDARLVQRSRDSRELIKELLNEEEYRAKERLNVALRGEKELDALIQEAKMKKLEWERLLRDHQKRNLAVQECFDIFEMDEVPIGAFTSLRDAINSGHDSPFARFYEDAYEARC
jgi:hypothetical protein